MTEAVPSAAQVACEKCKTGVMARTKIRRFSPALVIIGYTLWIPALLLLISTTACTACLTLAPTVAVPGSFVAAQTEALKDLRAIPDLPPAVIAEFDRSQTVSEPTLKSLPQEQALRVSSIVSTYHAKALGAGMAPLAGLGCGGCGMTVVYILGLPLFIVGLLLTLKKRVWRCGVCGFVFERA
jgi:hypothetical protein